MRDPDTTVTFAYDAPEGEDCYATVETTSPALIRKIWPYMHNKPGFALVSDEDKQTPRKLVFTMPRYLLKVKIPNLERVEWAKKSGKTIDPRIHGEPAIMRWKDGVKTISYEGKHAPTHGPEQPEDKNKDDYTQWGG